MNGINSPAPGHSRDDCPDLPEPFDLDAYIDTPMTNWFSPGVLLTTGVRDLLSRLFATYADRRATIAALSPAEPFTDYRDMSELWVDYVADLGDGWNSTYSVAWCLAQPQQVIGIDGAETALKRGNLLVMGGDQVYPYASADDYNRKLVRPYQAALPCTPKGKHPRVFAIPGNHDWYDGLRGFLRRFCQGHWLGGWKSAQTRPYWAVQLPHRWWLLGVDSQMDDYIDQAQIDFFKTVKLEAGDRIVLCIAAPSWIFAANGEQELHRNLAFFENEIITARGARLVVTLSGDLHHYAHYVSEDQSRHKITCGGGGAFTHGTHHLPTEIPLTESGQAETYRLAGQPKPTPEKSKKLLWTNLLFPFRHGVFAAVMGGVYLAYALVLAAAGLPQQLATVPLQPENFGAVITLFAATSFGKVWPFLVMALLIACGYGFAQPDWESNPDVKRVRKLIAGSVLALLHAVLLVLIVWYLSHRTWISLPPFAPDWSSAIKFSVAVFLAGAVGGGLLLGAYLIASNLLFGFHRTEAFSAVRDQHNKCFLRMHVTEDKLTIYPLALPVVEQNWEINPEAGENNSWIKPAGEERLAPVLIGSPIELDDA